MEIIKVIRKLMQMKKKVPYSYGMYHKLNDNLKVIIFILACAKLAILTKRT